MTPDGAEWPLAPLVTLPAVLALAVVPVSYSGITGPKALAAAGVAAWCWGCASWRRWWLREGRAFGAAEWCAVMLLAAATMATLSSDVPALSLIGAYERDNGLLAYLTGIALLLLIATSVSPRVVAGMTRSLAGGATVSVVYWLAQRAEWDPLGIKPGLDDYGVAEPFSAMLGNPNFAGAFLACAVPAAVWAALRPGASRRTVVAWAGTVPLLLWGIAGAASAQAPLAAIAGGGVLAFALLLRRSPAAAGGILAASALIAAVVTAGLLGTGPLVTLGAQSSLVERTWHWDAAIRMAADHPATGVGLARFGGWWQVYRSADKVDEFGWESFTDAAHSVPLEMAASGGVPLFAAYMGFVVAVGWRLWRGLTHLRGERLALLGAVGGVWAAYQVQSWVSIDTIALLILHYLAAGAILALTARSTVDAAADMSMGDNPGGRLLDRLRGPALRIAIAVLSVAGLTILIRENIADVFIQRAWDAAKSQHWDAARSDAARALRLMPWRPVYGLVLGDAQAMTGELELALDAHLAAMRRDDRDIIQVVHTARVAESLGRDRLALRILLHALRLEPRSAELNAEAAQIALRLGSDEQARALVDRALQIAPRYFPARHLRATMQLADRSS